MIADLHVFVLLPFVVQRLLGHVHELHEVLGAGAVACLGQVEPRGTCQVILSARTAHRSRVRLNPRPCTVLVEVTHRHRLAYLLNTGVELGRGFQPSREIIV